MRKSDRQTAISHPPILLDQAAPLSHDQRASVPSPSAGLRAHSAVPQPESRPPRAARQLIVDLQADHGDQRRPEHRLDRVTTLERKRGANGLNLHLLHHRRGEQHPPRADDLGRENQAPFRVEPFRRLLDHETEIFDMTAKIGGDEDRRRTCRRPHGRCDSPQHRLSRGTCRTSATSGMGAVRHAARINISRIDSSFCSIILTGPQSNRA